MSGALSVNMRVQADTVLRWLAFAASSSFQSASPVAVSSPSSSDGAAWDPAKLVRLRSAPPGRISAAQNLSCKLLRFPWQAVTRRFSEMTKNSTLQVSK